MRASVVVPVYDPGSVIEPCIASVLGQSLPPSDFEVIFVDDGSTDETPARLDALAAEHPNIRVIHTSNSGWAGRPRNIGIDAARGDYIQFLDQDDELTPEALERLTAMGDRNRSDIVIGRVASDFRRVPLGLFRANRERCTLADAPLIDSLTPHKMFRTAFLREHGLRYAEGRRRLEDQLFVVQAYVQARIVSILADHVCYRYRRRPDGQNASYTGLDPAEYYTNVREVMDVVVAGTKPGALRDTLLRRFFREEILGRLADRLFLLRSLEDRRALVAAVQGLIVDFGGSGVLAGLEPLGRVRIGLAGDLDVDGLTTLAERTVAIRLTAGVESLAWRSGRLAVSAVGMLEAGSGDPVTLQRSGDRWLLDPSLFEGLAIAPPDATEAVQAIHASISLQDPISGGEWALRTVATARLPSARRLADNHGSPPVPMQVLMTATLDPSTAAAGQPIPDGRWRMAARLAVAGLDRRAAVVDRRAGSVATSRPVVAGDTTLVVTLALTETAEVVIDVDLGSSAGRSPVSSRRRVAAWGRRAVGRGWRRLVPTSASRWVLGDLPRWLVRIEHDPRPGRIARIDRAVARRALALGRRLR